LKLSSAARRLLGLRVFRMFGRPLERHPGGKPDGLDLRVLGLPELLPLCSDAELNLRPDAVSAACARGDLCVGAFDGGTLAGYCWFAFRALPHLDGVWVRFDPAVAWTYKSLVLPAGRRSARAMQPRATAPTSCAPEASSPGAQAPQKDAGSRFSGPMPVPVDLGQATQANVGIICAP